MIVFIIIDGIKTEMIGDLKVFRYLATHGSYTNLCRPANPSLTEPCFAQMFHSIEPTHFACFFSDDRKYGTYPDYPKGIIGVYEHIEGKVRSAVVGTWPQLGNIVDLKDANDLTRKSKILDENVTETAVALIQERKTDFLTVYYEAPDHVGHEVGIGVKYQKCLVETAAQIVHIMKAMDPLRDTLVVTSDHSRVKKDHGWYYRTVMQTPLYFWGKHIKPKYQIKDFVSSMDIMPTLMAFFKIKAPPVWRGRIIREIFKTA